MNKRVWITVAAILILLGIFYIATSSISRLTGHVIFEEYFRGCLDGKNIKLFVDDSDSLDNMAVVDYLDAVEIVNCVKNENLCLVLGVDGFPSWMLGDNEIKGDISVEELAEFSDCNLK